MLKKLFTRVSSKLPDPVPPQEQIDQAISLFQGGHFVEAEKVLTELTQHFPTHHFGWTGLGAILNLTGRKKEALFPLQQAARFSPNDAAVHNNLGNGLRDLGRLVESEAAYREAIRLKHDYPEAHSNLGNTLRDLGRLVESEACYREAIHLRPEYAEAHINLGLTLKELGRLQESEAAYRESIRLQPDNVLSHYNLGITLGELGRFEDAEDSYQKALHLQPDLAEAYCNLGHVLQKLSRLEEAETACHKAIRLKPDSAMAFTCLGMVLKELERLQESEAAYREAIRLKPEYAEAHSNLGATLKELDRLQESEAAYREAIRRKPKLAEAHSNLGNVLRDLDRLAESEAAFREAIRLKPDFAEAFSDMGVTLKQIGRHKDAEAAYRQAIRLKPDLALAYGNLGGVYHSLGQIQEAETAYREAIDLKPDYLEATNNLLYLLSSAPHQTPAQYLEDARSFGRMVSKKVHNRYSAWCYPERPFGPIRVGLVSGDLRKHPVGYFLEGLCKNINPSRIELVAFPTKPGEDELTSRLKTVFKGWTTIHSLKDDQAAQAIHDQKVHILIDLSGHTDGNRLGVFAHRPAPVQLTWLGYWASTGLPEMDYLLGDPFLTPIQDQAQFTEQLWLLPETRFCFTTPDVAIETAPLPVLDNGYITFGCFNQLQKMGDAVVALWSRILHSVPNARLFLKSKELDDPSVRAKTRERFSRHGIESNRLTLEGASPRDVYLAAYHRIDLALDPFPYTGGTTSCEALWMGVPVLTKQGDRLLSRQGESIAYNAGLAAWVAKDEGDYLEKAVAFATDREQLMKSRHQLRERVLTSPLFDAPRFARHFEDALWAMWEQHEKAHHA